MNVKHFASVVGAGFFIAMLLGTSYPLSPISPTTSYLTKELRMYYNVYLMEEQHFVITYALPEDISFGPLNFYENDNILVTSGTASSVSGRGPNRPTIPDAHPYPLVLGWPSPPYENRRLPKPYSLVIPFSYKEQDAIKVEFVRSIPLYSSDSNRTDLLDARHSTIVPPPLFSITSPPPTTKIARNTSFSVSWVPEGYDYFQVQEQWSCVAKLDGSTHEFDLFDVVQTPGTYKFDIVASLIALDYLFQVKNTEYDCDAFHLIILGTLDHGTMGLDPGFFGGGISTTRAHEFSLMLEPAP